MLKSTLLAFGLFIALSARAENQAIAQLFQRAGVDGTIVIESLTTGQRLVHNDPRAQQRYPAASTFKVLNTLIALEEGAISGENQIFHWNGTQYSIANWNQDQTLDSAFKVSCVWCYQQIALRVGALKYPAYIQQTNYGHLLEPFNGTEFWLDGSLTISAEEQVSVALS